MSLIKISLITSLLVLLIACSSESSATPVPTPDVEATVQARVAKELNNQSKPLPTPSISSTDVEKAIATAVAKAISESITPTPVPTIPPTPIPTVFAHAIPGEARGLTESYENKLDGTGGIS